METIPESPTICLELARVAEIEARMRVLLDGYGTSPVREPILFLEDAGIQLDKNQFVRLPADFFCVSRRPPLQTIENHCKMANLSEIFYRCASEKQWLRTVVESRSRVDSMDPDVTIRSNVVPSQAYLMPYRCLGHQCPGGFFPAADLHLILSLSKSPPRPCKECALAVQLQGRAQADAAAASGRFWYLEVDDVKLVEDLGTGSEGVVSKILWRKGTFARKRFKCPVSFRRELDVALEVSHPNIVHFFGCSSPERRNSRDCDLFMELLSTDLGKVILEGARVTEGSGSAVPIPPFSFHDSLDVLLQIAQAMTHLHEMNFVHGDLKPLNILLDCFALTHSNAQYHLVKVADFGCAQRTHSSGATVKPFNSSIGTLKYTAPEVLRCRRDRVAPLQPQKIDVYSFGVVAFQVLTGVGNLYEDLSNSAIRDGVIQGLLRPDSGFNESSLNCENYSSLLPLTRRCWTQSPDDRPSFSQVCIEIQVLLRECNRIREERKAAISKGKGHAF